MQLNILLAVTLLAAGSAAAGIKPAAGAKPPPPPKDFNCQTDFIGKGVPKGKTSHKFKFTNNAAVAAMNAGGTSVGLSGFPHAFGGGSSDGGPNTGGGGGSGQLRFLGADARCNEKNPKLLEFPILLDGKISNKNDKRGGEGSPSPARVVYLQDGKTLCGVMTHVLEDFAGHQGTGNFRVCDQ